MANLTKKEEKNIFYLKWIKKFKVPREFSSITRIVENVTIEAHCLSYIEEKERNKTVIGFGSSAVHPSYAHHQTL